MSTVDDASQSIPGLPDGAWTDDAKTPGPITERTKEGDYDTEDDPWLDFLEHIPEAFRGPYFRELGKRKLQGRDAKTLVTAADGQTGVGKSSLCDFLAYVADTTQEGFKKSKVTIEPMEFIEMYNHQQPPRSAIVMEEAEQFDSRRSQSNKNIEGSHKWQQGRVREIFAFLNLPDPSMIDLRFEKLADFWINVERRGFARIYEKKIHATKGEVYYQTMQTFEWPNMDGSLTFRHMDSLKDDLIDGKTGADNLIRESEVERRIEKATERVQRECRDDWITALREVAGMKGGEIAALPTVDVGTPRVNQIARDNEL